MLMEDRRAEIVGAVKESLRLTANWIRSLQRTDPRVLSDLVVTALRNMVIVVEGDIPEECRDLYVAVRKFGEELHQYIKGYDGKVSSNGSPVGSFWNALSGVELVSMKADVSHVVQLESVLELRSQKVSDDQIASAIYGQRGVGPFMTANKIVNKRLLDRAAKGQDEQDEILKDAGWPSIDGQFYPPWMGLVNQANQKEIEDRLKAYKLLEEGQKRAEDPATIEEMINDGCYVQQIMDGKGVNRNDVLDVAKQMGVEVKDGPGFNKRFVPKPIDLPMHAVLREEGEPINTEDLQVPSQSLGGKTDDMTKSAIKAIIEGNPNFGVAEIVADLEASNMTASNQQIAAIMRTMKKTPANA